MKHISIDIETFSPVDLKKCGVYRYAEESEIILFAYSTDGSPVEVIDLTAGEEIPEAIVSAIKSPDVIKRAFNANFERVLLSHHLGVKYLDPASWRCSMVQSAYLGLPFALAQVGEVLNFDKQKMTEGKELIRLFCVPDRKGVRHTPKDHPEKWETFKLYNKRDVEVEMQIHDRLSNYPVPESVWEEFILDQRINDRGVLIDSDMVDSAIQLSEAEEERIFNKLQDMTGLENPRSVTQFKKWLQENGVETETLEKATVEELIKTAPEPARTALVLRKGLTKSSIKKYITMRSSKCKDGRIRGMFQFYGAQRTGRYAGRVVQLQNLKRNSLSELSGARDLVKQKSDLLHVLYPSMADVLSELVRTALVPSPGKKFIVADFSSIEARALSFLARERWKIEAFHKGEDIYCKTASKMFSVPVEKHGVNGDLRQKGKISELACGYGGSVGALTAMGALKMGLKEEELQPLVDQWRGANPHICKYWDDVDKAAMNTIRNRVTTRVGNVTFICKNQMLFIHLPSGRSLSYVKPGIGINRFGGDSITYYGLDSQKHWAQLESYGAKLVENITQAICRDILCFALNTLKDYDIVAHVHDEVIIEADRDTPVKEVCDLMSKTPDWITGLELKAEGYECDFYKKD